MSEESKSTRRSFLKGGALVAAPLAAVGAPAAALAASEHREKLARLEDEKAIRELHASWMRHLGNGDLTAAARLHAGEKSARALDGILSVSADRAGAPETLEIASSGLAASGRYPAIVETQTAIAVDNTLAQMLHVQGEGHVRTSEARTLKADYVKTREGNWAIAKVDFEQV